MDAVEDEIEGEAELEGLVTPDRVRPPSARIGRDGEDAGIVVGIRYGTEAGSAHRLVTGIVEEPPSRNSCVSRSM